MSTQHIVKEQPAYIKRKAEMSLMGIHSCRYRFVQIKFTMSA